MLWPPTPRVSPQLHQATSRPGFHGAWWYRSRTTRVLRDPPPARGKRQGGDDGRTKTTPQHRRRKERGRGPSLRARAPRGLHARRVCRTAIRASHASLVASSTAPARGGVASLRRADRGERREGRYDERRKKKRFTRIPQPCSAAAARAARSHDPYAPARVSRASPIAKRALPLRAGVCVVPRPIALDRRHFGLRPAK